MSYVKEFDVECLKASSAKLVLATQASSDMRRFLSRYFGRACGATAKEVVADSSV